jgi:hypothetical protein
MRGLGDAPSGLRDSSGRVRRPVGARILDGPRAQVTRMRPNGGSRALEGIIGDLFETRRGPVE